MKKTIIILLALLLILCVKVPVSAVTPPLDTPSSPTVPDISDDIDVELPESAFDDYIPHIDIIVPAEEPTEAPTEPSAENDAPNWLVQLFRWFQATVRRWSR